MGKGKGGNFGNFICFFWDCQGASNPLPPFTFGKVVGIIFKKQALKNLLKYVFLYLTYLHFFDILLLYSLRRIPWKTKSPKAS